MISYKVEEAPLNLLFKELLKRNFELNYIIKQQNQEKLILLLKNLGVVRVDDFTTTFRYK
jgi:hypothetical protein